MPRDELIARAEELERAASGMEPAARDPLDPDAIAATTELAEKTFRHLAETFSWLASHSKQDKVSYELFAVSQLCRAAYRQAWSARSDQFSDRPSMEPPDLPPGVLLDEEPLPGEGGRMSPGLS